MAKNSLQPTLNQSFRILHDEEAKGSDVNFSVALRRAAKAEQNGNFEEACEIRFKAVQSLVELLPEDEPLELDWEDGTTRDAITLAYLSAVDFFLVGDWEMAAAQLELVLDVDGDDHLEATTLLAFVYVAMQEWDSFDDIVPDLSEKSPERSILLLWSGFVRDGVINGKELATFRRYHAQYLREWIAEEHPTDGRYLADISSERPSKEAMARELWLQTEHLWRANSEFIKALKAQSR
jgi:hypothetical protein